MFPGIHPDFDSLLGLVGHIDFAGRVLAHQHHRKPGRQTMLGFQLGDGFRHAAAQTFRIGLAVNDLRHLVFLCC